MKFGENLKSLRKSKNISQEELSSKVGVSRQSVSKWECGEAYPEMSNIIALCTIFKCNINDLVNNNMIDLDSLDEEIKMNVVKFEKEKQKKMKGFSKAIYVIARVVKVVCIVGIVGVIIGYIGSLVFLSNSKFDTTNNTIEVFDNKIEYKLNDDRFIIEDHNLKFNLKPIERNEIIKFMNDSKSTQISFVTILFISLGVCLVFMFKLFQKLEKLFINIHDNDTPFVKENINYIKKIALYLLLLTLTPDVIGFTVELVYSKNLSVSISVIEYVYVGIVYILSYIFDYGYQIQLDSNGRMYGNE